MNKIEIINIIKDIVPKYNLEPELIMAVVATESNFDPWAMRYENHYRWLDLPAKHAARLKTTIETETTLQKFSWGLVQTMGAVLRELGFQNPLPMALDPKTNLDYGCRHLSNYLKKYKGNIEDAVSAYNQGSNKKNAFGVYQNHEYVKKVMSSYIGFKNFPST